MCRRYGQWPPTVAGLGADPVVALDFAKACLLAGAAAERRALEEATAPATTTTPKEAGITIDAAKGRIVGGAKVERPSPEIEAMLDKLWPPSAPPIL